VAFPPSSSPGKHGARAVVLSRCRDRHAAHAGHKLTFYRIADDFSADLDDVEERIGEDASALFVIHYFGFPQRLGPIKALCDRHGLKLIEDCALSLFSRDEEGPLGRVGDLALYSVYKTLPVPHGGFVVTKGTRGYPPLRPLHACRPPSRSRT